MMRAALLILAGVALAFMGPAPAPAQERTTLSCFGADGYLCPFMLGDGFSFVRSAAAPGDPS